MSEHLHLEETTPWVRWWLRAEGLAGLALGWFVWQSQGGELVWFVPLLLVPDVSMAGYLGGNHTGAIAYNFAHKIYELQRTKVFSKLKITHNYFEESKQDFKELASSAIKLMSSESSAKLD